jgi:tetratricopeptide (TPR) repeat protein
LNSAGQIERARPFFLDAWQVATAAQEDGYAVDAAHMLGIVEPGELGFAWNRKALALAQASDDPRARRWQGSLYNNLGWTYHDAGDYDQALEMFESAVAAWEADRQRERVPSARWAVARTLRSLGRVQAALAQQQALLVEIERTGKPDGYVQEELGECLLALGQAVEARPHFARAWALLSQDAWLAEAEPARLERLHTLSAADRVDEATGKRG